MKAGHVIRDKYELVEEAGKGGMAVVWRAVQRGDLGFNRTVAVKQMHPHLADRRIYVDMFAEEARVCSELLSPNIAQVYDFVVEDGNYYLVMEWVEGIDLGSFIRFHAERGDQPRWELVAAMGIGVLRALANAHERVRSDGERAPIVHRDVSPHNILITKHGMVKLIDWGLAFAVDRREELTDPGIVKGKMSYLSPEVVAGGRPKPAADQFATGSVLWEALVGRKLFEGETDFEVYKKVREAQVQPLRPHRRDVPRGFVSVINRSLAAGESQRFESAREMAHELGHVLKGGRSPRDLHQLLGRTVLEARETLELGRRTGEQSAATPVANLTAELEQEEKAEIEEREVAADGTARRRGLLHRLPFFRRWR
jgi:eukaryotic-like serine/threonine-protein kinase